MTTDRQTDPARECAEEILAAAIGDYRTEAVFFEDPEQIAAIIRRHMSPATPPAAPDLARLQIILQATIDSYNALRAENARLREALKRIADPETPWAVHETNQPKWDIKDIARAALGDK